MGIFSRIFKVGQAEAHNIVDKLEDPINMSEQAIRDLKKDLQKAMEALAEVKGAAIGMERSKINSTQEASEWERKAILLLERGKTGAMPVEDSERLATDALQKKEQAVKRANEAKINYDNQNAMVGKLTTQVDKLKRTITNQENELTTLKARARTASAMKKVNKQLSGIDSSSTLNMLERMKEKVDRDESLAAAYGEMEGLTDSLDSQIDNALESSDSSGQMLLEDLKSKLNK